MRPRWGNHFIEKATKYADQGKWDQAFHFARIGISKAPDNLEGRILLTNILFQANLIDRAVHVLESGTPYFQSNETYWKRLIEILLYYQVDGEVIRIIQNGLNENSIPDSQLNNATTALALAYYNQANYTEALATIKGNPILKNKILRTRIHFDSGLESLAIMELEALDKQHPNNKKIIPLLTQLYIESGKHQKGHQLARDSYLKNSYSIEATLNFLNTLDDKQEIQHELKRFIERAPEIYQNESALIQLLNFLAEKALPTLLDELLSNAPIHTRNSPIVWFIKIEAQLNTGEFNNALTSLQNPPTFVNLNSPTNNTLHCSLRLSALSGSEQSEEATKQLQELLDHTHIRPATLLQLSQKLCELNHPIVAEKIIQYLLKENPGHHQARVQLIKINILLEEHEKALQLSQEMLERGVLPFKLKEALVLEYSSDYTLRKQREIVMLGRILETLTPTRKQEMLNRL